MNVGNSNPGASFQAASGIDPSNLSQTIGVLAVVVCLLWAAVYLRRVFFHGWQKGDMAHILLGSLLAMVLLFFVSWTVTNY